MDQSAPLQLSVVVAIVSDTTSFHGDSSQLCGCLEALSKQLDPPSMEIIVPYHDRVANIDEVKSRFPDVKYIHVDDLKLLGDKPGSREHHDELRARGLALAKGEIIGLLEDHARPDLQWCARVVEAHQQDIAAAGGAIENGIDRPLNWAVYFCDFGKYQNPVPAGPSWFASDANVAYKRSALDSISETWQQVFHETMVNSALLEKGGKIVLSPDIVVYQHRTNLKLGAALKERFIWGRSYAGTRCRLISGAKRMLYALLSPALPFVLLYRMTINVVKKGRCVGSFFKAVPLTAMLTASWALGELTGYLTGRSSGS
jgi:hypothetical protein